MRKERKDKKKSKTSLKDFQNILLEEAKRKISDTFTGDYIIYSGICFSAVKLIKACLNYHVLWGNFNFQFKFKYVFSVLAVSNLDINLIYISEILKTAFKSELNVGMKAFCYTNIFVY